jgi:hypothetical protein
VQIYSYKRRPMELTPWAFLFTSFPTQTSALKPFPLRCSNLTHISFGAGCIRDGLLSLPLRQAQGPILSSGADASCSERHLCTQHYKEERSSWAFLYSLQLHHITHKQKTNKPIPLRCSTFTHRCIRAGSVSDGCTHSFIRN